MSNLRGALQHGRTAGSDPCDRLALAYGHGRRAGAPHHRATDGSATRTLPQRRPTGPHRALIGHHPCGGPRRGGHTTWTFLEYGRVVYGPPGAAG
jgi:hypothetical protein